MRESRFFSKYYFLTLGLSTYPVTLLFTSNYLNTSLVMYLIPLAIVYLFSTSVYLVFYSLRNKFLLENYHLSASIVSIVFFIYGIYYSYLLSSDSLLGLLGSHRFLLPITIAILFGIVYFITKINKTAFTYKFLIVFLVSFNVLPFFTVVDHFIFKNNQEVASTFRSTNKSFKNSPNIYYIILDGYGSNGSLKSFLNYDNSNFTDQLEKMGFKVQKNANSNYCRTIFSLSSTLNLNYIQNTIKTNITQENMNSYLSKNLVSEFLKAHGYTYYLFDSGFGLKKNYDQKEVLVQTNELGFLQNLFTTSDNDVLNSFINNSMFQISKNAFFANLSIKNYAAKVLNVFSKLPQIAEINNKKLVFAHIISPHPPFLFDRYGKIGVYGVDKATEKWEWDPKLYVEQIKFINTKTILALKKVIKNDKEDKIIIVQGDHGTRTVPETKFLDSNQKWIKEEYGILNAIYISKSDKSKEFVYSNWNHSSVNTFRLIFNEYYGCKFPLLENNKYFTELKEPYLFVKIKSSIKYNKTIN